MMGTKIEIGDLVEVDGMTDRAVIINVHEVGDCRIYDLNDDHFSIVLLENCKLVKTYNKLTDEELAKYKDVHGRFIREFHGTIF